MYMLYVGNLLINNEIERRYLTGNRTSFCAAKLEVFF